MNGSGSNLHSVPALVFSWQPPVSRLQDITGAGLGVETSHPPCKKKSQSIKQDSLFFLKAVSPFKVNTTKQLSHPSFQIFGSATVISAKWLPMVCSERCRLCLHKEYTSHPVAQTMATLLPMILPVPLYEYIIWKAY